MQQPKTPIRVPEIFANSPGYTNFVKNPNALSTGYSYSSGSTGAERIVLLSFDIDEEKEVEDNELIKELAEIREQEAFET